MNSVMNKNETYFVDLLKIFGNIVEANKGVQAKNDSRIIDAESLALKYFSHAISSLYIYRGVNIPDLFVPISNFPDPFSFNVLVRSSFETFLVFYYIYIDTHNNVDKFEFRYNSWELSSLFQRQKFPAETEENIKKLEEERKLIDQLIARLEKNPLFNSKMDKEKKQYIKKLKHGRWRSKSWIDIAKSAGLSDLNSQHIYQFLSEHAHSGNISATQVNQSFDPNIRRKIMEGPLDQMLIVTANFIKSYTNYFPKSKDYYLEKYPEPNVVSCWVEIGSGNV